MTAKLLDALPLDERREISSLSTKVDFVPASVPAKGQEWVEPLIGAIRDRLTVEMDYWALSKQKLTQRRVDPYHLRHFAGAWYLIGYDHQTRYLPVFHLARVKRLTLTEDRFKPAQFDPSTYFRNTFGITAGGTPKLVRVRLTGRAARTADERQWPAGFKYEPSGSGEGILSGKVGRMDYILAWAAGFRGDAEVLPG